MQIFSLTSGECLKTLSWKGNLICLLANYFGSSFNESSTVNDKEGSKAFLSILYFFFFGKTIKRV